MIVLKSEHFILRHSIMDDARAYLKFWQDLEVMQYIGDGTWGGGLDKVYRALQSNIDTYQQNPKLGYCSVVFKDSQEVVGDAGLSVLSETGEIEVGYLLRKDFLGQGFGYEILSALLMFGFQNLKLSSIVAVTHPDNHASIQLLKKVGLKFESTGLYHGRQSFKYSKTQ